MTDDELVAAAHAVWPATWVPRDAFVAHVHAVGGEPAHAADLYLALACARGVHDALVALEHAHLVRIREFAAGVDSRPGFVAELTQRLRARLLVPDGERPARIATYSGRGSLGGWVRVAAVRLARDLAKAERDDARPRELPVAQVDPELGYLKRAYGDAVSRAVQDALAALTGDARLALKLHYVDGLSIEQVGAAFGKSRATSARLLAAARLALVADIRTRLETTCGVAPDEADSLMAFVRSRLELDLSRALR